MGERRQSRIVKLRDAPARASRRAAVSNAPPKAAANDGGLAHELLIDAHGCDAAALTSVDRLQRLCSALIEVMGVKVLGAPMLHVFPSTEHGAGGVTALYLLSESHLALHTWPERQALLVSVCCCRPLPADPVVLPLLRSLAGAERASARRLVRGAP